MRHRFRRPFLADDDGPKEELNFSGEEEAVENVRNAVPKLFTTSRENG